MDVFRIEETVPENTNDFIQQFLGSNDFDQIGRKRIAYQLNLDVRQDSSESHLSSQIAEYLIEAHGQDITNAAEKIVEEILNRPRKYVAFKYGTVRKKPQLENPRKLTVFIGEPTWYGPIKPQFDLTASWYIRPMIFRFQEVKKTLAETPDTDTQREISVTKECKVRWLCLARLTTNGISLHWSNFTTEKGTLFLDQETPFIGRFPYWDYVPKLFKEIIELTDASVNDIRLENVILNSVWDQYREDKQYSWTDIRVRAEHRGVALTAKGSATHLLNSLDMDNTDDEDLDEEDIGKKQLQGIKYLATTLRKTVELRLKNRHQIVMPEPDLFDEEILRTLIKAFNPKSYEFQIDRVEDGKMISGAHMYFGKRPGFGSSDAFTHMSLRKIRELTAIEQIDFLMSHFDSSKHLHDEPQTSSSKQQRLF